MQGALGGLIFWFRVSRADALGGCDGVSIAVARRRRRACLAAGGDLLSGDRRDWQGIVLIAYGVLVIGLVDNVLRPILVGKDTKMPDYVVLIATLGGMAIFGINGFVIGPIIAAMFMAVWDIFAVSRAQRQG